MSAAKKPAAKKTAAGAAGRSGTRRATQGKTVAKKTAARAQPKKTTAKKSPARTTRAGKSTAKSTARARKTPKAATKKPVARRPQPKKATAKGAASSKATRAKPGSTAKKTTAPREAASARTGRRSQADKPVATRPRLAVRRPEKKTTRPPRPAKLDKEALRGIRARLEEELGDLSRRMEELEETSFEGTQSDLTGEVGLDEDFADAGTATFERERDLSIRNNISDLIDQITRAIHRIDDGTYGMCERCGGPIDAARLKALPHAVLCMDCKRKEERAR